MKTLAWKALPCGGVGSRGAARVSRFAAGLCVVAVVAAAGIARGQTPTTWSGANNAVWGTSGNWSGGVPSTTIDAVFNTAANNVNLNVSGTVSRLVYSGTQSIAGTASSAMATGTLTIMNGVNHSANSGSTFTRIPQIVLGGNQDWSLNGPIGSPTGGTGMTIAGAGSTIAGFSLNGFTLTKTGTGQLSFGGATVGNGTLLVNAGSVRLSGGGSGQNISVSGTGSITVAADAALFLGANGGTVTLSKAVVMSGGGTDASRALLSHGNSALSVSGPQTITAPIAWSGFAEMQTLVSQTTAGLPNWTYSGDWSGDGTVILTNSGTGEASRDSVLTLSGSNADLTGLIDNRFSRADRLIAFGSANAGSANAEWKLSHANAGYRLNGNSVSLGALSGTAGRVGNYGTTTSSTATIGGKGTDTTFSGLLVDGSTASLAVVKTGAGTLTLGNANTYTGLTDIQAGTLASGTNNALGSGGVTVSGGRFDIGGFSDSVDAVTLTGGTIAGTTGVLAASSYDLRSGVVSAILGGSGISLTKSTSGTVALSGVSTYTGATAINAGLLKVDGSIAASSGLSVAAAAWLAGSGTAPAVSGAGLISPGSSPGILTTASIDPSAGMGFGFELTGTGSPNYGSPTSSVNDVLRLTGGTPSLAALTGSNAVSVYFGTTIADGDVFRGGTYVDSATTSGSRTAFESAISGGDWQFFVLGNGGGTHAFNGQNYYTLGEYDPSLTISRSVVADPADFGSGVINGSVTQFVVVPEPNAVALVAMAVVGFAVAGGRLRLRDRQVG